jgi:hypothetical protein
MRLVVSNAKRVVAALGCKAVGVLNSRQNTRPMFGAD